MDVFDSINTRAPICCFLGRSTTRIFTPEPNLTSLNSAHSSASYATPMLFQVLWSLMTGLSIFMSAGAIILLASAAVVGASDEIRKQKTPACRSHLKHRRQKVKSRIIPERTVRWRTVASELSMGLVVRRCFQCSAGKS